STDGNRPLLRCVQRVHLPLFVRIVVDQPESHEKEGHQGDLVAGKGTEVVCRHANCKGEDQGEHHTEHHIRIKEVAKDPGPRTGKNVQCNGQQSEALQGGQQHEWIVHIPEVGPIQRYVDGLRRQAHHTLKRPVQLTQRIAGSGVLAGPEPDVVCRHARRLSDTAEVVAWVVEGYLPYGQVSQPGN